jgi:outer membrane autotransporter protein
MDFRGTDFYRGTVGEDMKGTQVNVIVGLTHLITPNFLVGALGGYERFDYSSQAYNGVLKGDGWTTGGYLGWLITGNLRFDASAAWSDILADNHSGTAVGNFTGSRWLTSAGLTGTYDWQRFVVEPSARVYALWEHETAYTDSLGILQPARSFETGRASGGSKVSYPFAWSDDVKLTPYAGLFADYYFTGDNALTRGLTTVPLLQGWAARATGGLTATFINGAQLGAGAELSGLGNQTHIWTWTVRGKIPF